MKTNPFVKSFTSVVCNPIYIIFGVVLIVYAIAGNIAEAAFLLLFILLNTAAKAAFRLKTEKVFGDFKDRQDKKNKFLTVGRFNTVSLILSVVSAVLAVPILIIGLVKSDGSGISSVLSRVLAALTLSLSMLYTKDGSAMEYSMVLHLADKNSASSFHFRDVDSLQRIASCDTAVILNPSLLYDRNAQVREVFFDTAVYRGMSLSESELSVPAERAYFLSLIALCCAENGFKIIPSHEDAFDSFNTVQCMSKTSFYLSAKRMSPCPDYPYKGDITVFTEFSGKNTSALALTRSVSQNAVNMCDYYRRNDGLAVQMTEYARNSALGAMDSLLRRGLSPYVIISSDYTKARNGVLYRPVLEAIFGVGGVFPETNSDAASALDDYGVRPVLVMPDAKASFVNFAGECGIADGKDDINIYEGKDGYIEYSDARKVYIGYRDESVLALLRSMKQQGRRPLCVLRNSKDLCTLSEAEASVAVINGSDKETLAVADTSVPCAADNQDNGIGALFNVVTLASSAVAKIGMLRNIYFTFSVSILVSIFITLVSGTGEACPSALMLLFSCGITALTAALIFAEDKLITRNMTSVLYNPQMENKRYFKYLGLGIMMSVALIAVGLLVFGDSTAELRKYLSIALPLSGISLIESERLFRSKSYGISGINLYSLLTVLVSVLLSLGLAFVNMPSVLRDTFGYTEQPFKVLLFSILPSLVPFVYLLIAEIIRRNTAEENVNNL